MTHNKRYIIRIENIGVLIWNPFHKCYYMASPSVSKELISLYDCGNTMNYPIVYMNNISGISATDIELLESARVIDNRNKSRRPLFAPLEYYFDYTNNCNLNCSGCYNKEYINSSSMPASDISQIISEMKELGIMRLHLAGGEPTIDVEKLETYLIAAYRNDIILSMATNGTLLTEDVCKLIISHDLLAVSVSIDGFDEESNSIRRGGGNFTKSVQGIRNLIREKSEQNSRTEICIKPTYTPHVSSNFFEKMILLAIELGVDKIKFANPERSLHHSKGYYGDNINQYYYNMDILSKMVSKYQDQIKITFINNPHNDCGIVGINGVRGCIGGQELIAINPDGRISPCLMNDTNLGNYYEYGSMKSFFSSAESLDTYLSIIKCEECNSCNIYPLCRGGCQVRKIVEYGRIVGKDPCCPRLYKGFNQSLITKDSALERDFYPIIVTHSL